MAYARLLRNKIKAKVNQKSRVKWAQNGKLKRKIENIKNVGGSQLHKLNANSKWSQRRPKGTPYKNKRVNKGVAC